MAATAGTWSKSALKLFTPSIEEVATVLQQGLANNFASVQVSVVDCPDLSQAPFNLASPGLCGDQKVVDVGGPSYLLPLVDRTKVFDIRSIANETGTQTGLVVGAGAGPWPVVGVNCELAANVHIDGDSVTIKSKIAKVNAETMLSELYDATTDGFALMANLYISKGSRDGKVLEVKASKRSGDENYMSCIRKVLREHYGEQPVALGGTFQLEKGTAKFHVMPDFSACPLDTREKLDGWLKFYEYEAPMTAVGYLVSHDPGLDLRVEHFHCFNDRGVGGHYHYDVTPEEVSYCGYFGIAETLYRVAQPPNTADFGKD